MSAKCCFRTGHYRIAAAISTCVASAVFSCVSAQIVASPGGALAHSAGWPLWAQPRQVSVAEGKPWEAFHDSRLGTENMRRNVGRLRYAVEKNEQSPDRPFLILQLVLHLAELDEDALALQTLQTLFGLPDDTPHNSKLWLMPTLQSVKESGYRIQAKLFARNGRREDALSAMGRMSASGGYRAALEAEIHMLLGDTARALELLPQAQGGGHPENAFSDVFLRLRAASMAAAMNEQSLVVSIAEPVLSRPLDSQKHAQWQASWSVLKAISDEAAAGPMPQPAKMKNGVFTGVCRGFIKEIEVSVQLSAGRIAAIKIVRQKEDRPWSALDVIPQRILRRQSLQVDAVTGATISSCAVLAAVEDALRKAAQ